MTPLNALGQAVDEGLLPAGGPLLVACSGGADSMALVGALLELGLWSVHVATVDHGLHPESADHAQWVVDWWAGRASGTCLLVGDVDLIRAGEGIEDGARRERYRLLEEARKECGSPYIVTAHHADDQAETLLMRLADGAGVNGLRGIHARQSALIRPWLGVSRDEIESYRAAAGIESVLDCTNRDLRFRRNRLRAEAMPNIAAALGASWVKGAAKTARHVQEALDVERAAPPPFEQVQSSRGVGLMPRDGAGASARRNAIFVTLSAAYARWCPGEGRGWGRHVDTVNALFQPDGPPGPVDLPYGLSAWREGTMIWVGPKVIPRPAPPPIEIHGPGVVRWGDWLVEVTRSAPECVPGAGRIICVEHAPFPWTVRAVLPGDRYRRAGAPGRKGITRQWSDRKVPREHRALLPVVEGRSGLVWVARLGPNHDVSLASSPAGVRITLHFAPLAPTDSRE